MSVYSDPSHGGTEGVEAPHHSVSEDPKKSSVYNTNYVLTVLNIMQDVGLQPIEDTMQTESQLMDTTAEMQADLTTIQEYLTRIENLAHSGGAWKMGDHGWKPMPPGQKGWFGPNADNGIAYNEFHENPNLQDGKDYTVSSDFQNATNGFIAAMKDLFVGEPCSKGAPSACSNFTKFSVNKTDSKGNPITQNFDLSSVFNQLNGNTSNGWGILEKYSGQGVFSTSDSHSASLIQQYTYYQYKLNAEQYHGLVPNEDLSKLGFTMDPTSPSFDGVGKSMFGLLNSFNTSVTVDRENDSQYKNNGEFSNTSENFLYYIFENPYGINPSGVPNLIGGSCVNIYGAFSYAAFNYYWTKNPSASTDQKDNTVPQPPAYNGGNGAENYGYDKDDKGVVSDGDKLSIWYSDSQSSASLLSSQANENSTTMQQYSSEVSQYQNIGQNIIKSNSENLIATVHNYKSG